ncbi:hypothetical protein X801_08362, partial [Opisthorchis viverrini]
LMMVKDDRIKLLNQTFVGIKVLKMYAWELAFQDRITKLRDKEVNLIRKMAYLRSVNSVTAFCAPILMSAKTFKYLRFFNSLILGSSPYLRLIFLPTACFRLQKLT